jgi:hypothetical protein
VAERPILFNGEMVRAIIEGRKLQTRRPAKFPPKAPNAWEPTTIGGAGCTGPGSLAMPEQGAFWNTKNTECLASPFGFVGDRLWVRETWSIATGNGHRTIYRADLGTDRWPASVDVPDPLARIWKPSIHMKRAQSRLSLLVTDVRVERLHDITEADALAEGVSIAPDSMCRAQAVPLGSFVNYAGGAALPTACASFRSLWRAVYGSASLEANPYVWAVTFAREVPNAG